MFLAIPKQVKTSAGPWNMLFVKRQRNSGIPNYSYLLLIRKVFIRTCTGKKSEKTVLGTDRLN